MKRRMTGAVLAVLLSFPVLAADYITREQIQTVISATDEAARQRDAAAIALYLGDSFERIIEVAHGEWLARVKLDRDKYLGMIDAGWAGITAYDYRRDDTVIHIRPDGLTGVSFSTITEHMVVDGMEMTSRFREHATYAMESGRPVITEVTGHTLIGDTTDVASTSK